MANKFFTPLWSVSDLQKFIERHTDQAEAKIIMLLQRTGEEFVKVARESGKYNNWTGNLRSSIGYIILKDGNVISSNFKQADQGTDKATGVKTARDLTRELASVYNKGYVLIGCAGMSYAAKVEAIEGKDVISTAVIKADEYVKKQSKLLFNNLK